MPDIALLDLNGWFEAYPVLRPMALAGELFALLVVPNWIFARAGFFAPDMAFKLAAGLAALLYLALPDPVDIGWIDDLIILTLIGILVLPTVRHQLLDLIARRAQQARARVARSEAAGDG